MIAMMSAASSGSLGGVDVVVVVVASVVIGPYRSLLGELWFGDAHGACDPATKAPGPTRSSRFVLTRAFRNASLSMIPRWKPMLVVTPPTSNSASARRERASAISRVSPHTI